jgi:hypothetical protein
MAQIAARVFYDPFVATPDRLELPLAEFFEIEQCVVCAFCGPDQFGSACFE